MRIAHIGSVFHEVSFDSESQEGREIAVLSAGLVRAGHDVTVFASGDSKTVASLVPMSQRALRHHPAPMRNLSEGLMYLALEKAFGRHVATVQTISGVYRKTLGDNPVVDRLQDKLEAFAKKFGGKPRILVAKMGQDGHDRGQKVIATAFADLGFDVTVGAMFQTPEEIAKLAIEHDVHIVGASSLAAGHLTLIPELRDALKKLGRSDMLIVAGGVIPPQDYDAVLQAGAAEIFPPGTVIPEAADPLMDRLLAG